MLLSCTIGHSCKARTFSRPWWCLYGGQILQQSGQRTYIQGGRTIDEKCKFTPPPPTPPMVHSKFPRCRPRSRLHPRPSVYFCFSSCWLRLASWAILKQMTCLVLFMTSGENGQILITFPTSSCLIQCNGPPPSTAIRGGNHPPPSTTTGVGPLHPP